MKRVAKYALCLSLPVLLVLLAPAACKTSGPGGEPAEEGTHADAFPGDFKGAETCLKCHPGVDKEVMATAHWRWEGLARGIVGHEDEIHGKTDLINNFCIAIASNEGRCTQCHAGYGWKDADFDFLDPQAIDCLVCHDGSGDYEKGKKSAGMPVKGLNLKKIAKSVTNPTRRNCGVCHFYAGGDDNVKHGDLSTDLIRPTREMDVHMDASGTDFSCQRCHYSARHDIAGMALHSHSEGRVTCRDCHEAETLHENPVYDAHSARIACQTCHIPAFARSKPTKVEWYWDEAGKDVKPVPKDQYGMKLYDKKKGRFVWAKNVRPSYRWYDGRWKRKIVGVSDTFDTTPVVLAEPVGSKDDPNSLIYPFKRMVGRQPADAKAKRLVVPHLFGEAGGKNAYWDKFDWRKAIEDGTKAAGQPFSGEYEFVDTVMYLSLNHEIAPKEKALTCDACHDGGIDFTELGYEGDPAK